jgi:hypothetical protein
MWDLRSHGGEGEILLYWDITPNVLRNLHDVKTQTSDFIEYNIASMSAVSRLMLLTPPVA